MKYQSFFSRHTFIYDNIPKTLSLFYSCISVLSIVLYKPILTLEQYSKLDYPPLISFIQYLSPEVIICLNNISPVILFITALFPKSQPLRILSALFYTFSYALHCSFGVDSHDQLTLVYCAIASAFIPSLTTEKITRIKKHIRIIAFWVFHAAFLLPYFVSGLTKLLYAGIYQLFFDDISLYSPYAMAHITENYLELIKEKSWLGDLVINNIYLSAPLYIMATLLELFVLLPLFFPKLWKWFILKLIIFHFFVNIILNIYFFSNMLVLLIVFYNTPFSYPLRSLKESLIKLKRKIR